MLDLGNPKDNIEVIPIFPLPDVVLFPKTVLPLHIFEQKYRQMVAETLEQDSRIGMVLLKPGWESDFKIDPELYSVGGLGVISDYEELDDGRFDIVLTGVGRFEILEVISDSPYPKARVRMLDDLHASEETEIDQVQDLIRGFGTLVESEPYDRDELKLLLEADFETLVNSVCSAVTIPAADKQALLELDQLGARAQAVLSILNLLLSQKEMITGFEHLRPNEPGLN